jgi:phospholipid-binding lipoprotein MlaA
MRARYELVQVPMQSTIRVSALSLILLGLFGCASAPITKPDPRDPFERVNRVTYKFNDKLDKGFARPVARTYRRVTPQFVQTGVTNFMDNLEYPIVIVNDLLQGRFVPFAKDTGRLVMNTTLGIGGLFDPASDAGLDKNNNDFGQTLGRWGAGPGPYLVLPILGPSDVRDGLGLVADEFANPRHYIQDNTVEYSLAAVRLLDVRAHLLDAQRALDASYDPYLFLKNAYLQRRQFLISGGGEQPVNEEEQEQKLLEEAGENAEQPSPQPPEQPQEQEPKTEPPPPPQQH